MLSGLTAAGIQDCQLLGADKATETMYTCTGLCASSYFPFIVRATLQSWFRLLAPPQPYLPPPSVSPLFSIPSTFLLSLLASNQLSERAPSTGSGSAGPAHRLLSAYLTSHTTCASQVLASIALHQPGSPLDHQSTGGFGNKYRPTRTSVPGVLDASVAGSPNFISPALRDCRGPSPRGHCL